MMMFLTRGGKVKQGLCGKVVRDLESKEKWELVETS